jgi:hypothetical protein
MSYSCKWNQIYIKRSIMNLRSIRLDTDSYHEYLSGKEVICHAKEIAVGEQVLVVRDSTANHTDAGVPTRERQADYIGVNGTVTAILNNTGSDQQIMIRKL